MLAHLDDRVVLLFFLNNRFPPLYYHKATYNVSSVWFCYAKTPAFMPCLVPEIF
jgi:hypothetical protein